MKIEIIKDNINKLTFNELLIISEYVEDAFNNENTLKYNEEKNNLT